MTTQISLPGIEPAQEPTKRVFFALFPDDNTVRHLAKLAGRLRSASRLGGNVLRAESFHVTLFHIDDYVEVPPDIVARARQAGSLICAPAFELGFDRAVSFLRGERNKPFVLRCSDANVALLDLQQELLSAMRSAGLKIPRQNNFVPHLTLLYDEKIIGELAIARVGWRVREFALVLSHLNESRYDILGSWQLQEPVA